MKKKVTITVSMKDLVDNQNINTSHLIEGAGKIRDMVVEIISKSFAQFKLEKELNLKLNCTFPTHYFQFRDN